MNNKEKIELYLENEKYVQFFIKKEEIANESANRYLELLKVLYEEDKWAKKFCEKVIIHFEVFENDTFIADEKTKVFAEKMLEVCPPLFFFLAKKYGSIKELVLLLATGDEVVGDNVAVDPEKFHKFLKQQQKEIIIMSKRLDFKPEDAEKIIIGIDNYFAEE